MTDIVFEPYTTTTGSVLGQAARPRGYISDVARQAVVGTVRAGIGRAVAGTHAVVLGSPGKARGLATDFAHNAVVGFAGRPVGFATNITVVPTIAVVMGFARAPQVSATGHHTTTATVLGRADPARGFASDFIQNAVVGYAAAPRVSAREHIDYAGFVSAFMSPGYLFVSSHGGVRKRLTAHLRAGGTPLTQIINSIVERMALSARPDTVLQAVSRLTDSAELVDQIAVVWNLLLQDTVNASGVASPSLIAMQQVAELLSLVAGPNSHVSVRNLVAQTLALNDALAVVAKEQIGETVQFEAAFSAALKARSKLLDSLLLESVPTGSALVLAVVDDSFSLDESPTSMLQALNRLQDSIGFSVTFTIGDDTFVAWVVNTETRAAVTYEGWRFNSMTEFEGKYYGVAADGLYALEGADDAGEDIRARFRLGMSNMGIAKEKRLPAIYWGIRQDGRMLIKIITTDETGVKIENWYQLAQRGAGGAREARTQIGRGLKSVFWDMEIENIAGADFEFDNIQLQPMILDRRVRGRDN